MPQPFDPAGLRAVMADPSGFGQDCVAPDGTAFRGVYDRTPVGESVEGGRAVTIWRTTLLVDASALPTTVKRDAVVTVGGDCFQVRVLGPVDDAGQRELTLVEA